MSKRNDKWWLTLDETKDDLKNAHGFTYDKTSTTWVPERSSELGPTRNTPQSSSVVRLASNLAL
jgi:hypothetical protein